MKITMLTLSTVNETVKAAGFSSDEIHKALWDGHPIEDVFYNACIGRSEMSPGWKAELKEKLVGQLKEAMAAPHEFVPWWCKQQSQQQAPAMLSSSVSANANSQSDESEGSSPGM